jgi:membrane-associated protein
VVSVLLVAAAIIGDAVNYAVGRYVGPRVFRADDSSGTLHRLLNRHHLDRAHEFFERHGGKAVVLARFVPIVRTFVPFVAGVAEMSYRTFAMYNVTGGLAWVVICLGAGYLFGNVPIVKENFSLVALGIVFVSLLPMAFEYLRYRRQSTPPRSAPP